MSDISVVIPAYNRPALLKNAVESLLAQTIPVSEIIVVDDGSTEDVAGMIQRNIRERSGWGERVRYFYQENQGQSVAFNRGIAEARGEWLGVLGSDDLWLPNKLEWQLRALERFGGECGLCFADGW